MTYNLIYHKNLPSIHRIFPDEEFQFFHISFTPERFLQLIASSVVLTEKYTRLFAEEKFYILHSSPPKISASLMQLIETLRQVDFNNPLADMLAEAIIMSIIVQVHTIELRKEKESGALGEVKRFLEVNYLESFTIRELSRRFGINEFALKRDFKANFNNTIFGYVQELRMEEAKRQLLSGKSIKEVAFSVGYEHPQHFSTAFRKWYNITPSDLK